MVNTKKPSNEFHFVCQGQGVSEFSCDSKLEQNLKSSRKSGTSQMNPDYQPQVSI